MRFSSSTSTNNFLFLNLSDHQIYLPGSICINTNRTMDLEIVPIKRVALDIVTTNENRIGTSERSSTYFNTCNHRKDEISGIITANGHFEHTVPPWGPYMYSRWLDTMMTSQGLEKNKYRVISFPPSLFNDLMQCFSGWINRGKLNEELVDDLAEAWLSSKYAPRIQEFLSDKHINESGDWFVRLDQNCPKDSELVPGPVRNIKDIIRKLASSMRAYGALQHEADEAQSQNREMNIKVFLTPWNKSMDPRHEFRVFVPPPGVRDCKHSGRSKKWYTSTEFRISAISQYYLFRPFPVEEFSHAKDIAKSIFDDADSILVGLKENIMGFDQNTHTQIMKHGFTFDVSWQGFGTSAKLVEINPFGAMSGCGGRLFNWLDDAKVLYGLGQPEKTYLNQGDQVLVRMTL